MVCNRDLNEIREWATEYLWEEIYLKIERTVPGTKRLSEGVR